ncbi:chromosome-partitioning protein parB [Streptococcus dysgalactiae subsp. dysgalactiae]|uniref:Chromosome-partitioning protein parB n=1 Tax=Streptococcus dysgalactiae subsp. dysgalactiae TaxID=99822 RepID=A0A380JZ30_STRDY|nr:ParB/RepB/Spo0J family partition protein [Streptococcus dysgalactiae]MCB2834214.1 ParB/RepB/Spo0J family partition protein [Streptococcus dysgalactiae subsp. dysgalactiae]MCB2841830.1 ParB/RepB/Spo0J family partition protein [Streptococcus dysgalactiae subsp. dysgalactiae]MCB2845628.1 ParB/RepB/Spo0J family partition protein [Streptococcus dysgalactiae subsp. dysgalactiae]SUN52092.1 chromosome-partitioning protein parB [Streptococcus dysgalactiae subsp. dysgalactiae]
MTELLKSIPIEDIVANPYQPRLQFNQKELEDLANSIKTNGLIQPIIVRKSDIFGYELVAGERRFKASKMAGLTKVPAIVKNMSSLESMQQAIVENLQRADLNPIEEAKAYQLLIEKNQMTHEEVAKYMGKSRPYISNTLRLLQLPKTISKAVEEGDISAGHARALLTLTDEKEQLVYANRIKNEGLSVRQIEHMVTPKLKSIPIPKNKNIFITSLEDQLAQSLGLPVKIKLKSTQSGQLLLPFANQEELNRIINKLL